MQIQTIAKKYAMRRLQVFIIKADFPWKEWEQSDLSRLKACVSSTRYVAQSILAIMEFK